MKTLDRARWHRVSPHLDDALALPQGDREGWLARLRMSDPELAGELEALLEEHRVLCAKRFLDREDR